MNNTMTREEYIKKHIMWLFICLIWFVKLFFRCLPQLTLHESWIVFGGLAFAITAINIYVTIKSRRNYVTLIETLLLVFGTYVCIAFQSLFSVRIQRILIIAGGVSAFMMLFILLRKIKQRGKKRRIMRRRVYRCVYCFRRNMAVAMMLIMLPIGIKVLFTGTVLNSKVDVTKIYGDEYCMNDNMSALQNILPDKWTTLSVQEKLDLCQIVANCEGRYLGLPHELNVSAANLSENTLGYYKEDTHQIVLNIDCLEKESSKEVLETVIHEAYHSYQYALVQVYQQADKKSRNLLMFYNVSLYLEEFTDYQDGQEDFAAYYGQTIEHDARKYSEANVEEYFWRVEESVLEQEKE